MAVKSSTAGKRVRIIRLDAANRVTEQNRLSLGGKEGASQRSLHPFNPDVGFIDDRSS